MNLSKETKYFLKLDYLMYGKTIKFDYTTVKDFQSELYYESCDENIQVKIKIELDKLKMSKYILEEHSMWTLSDELIEEIFKND